MTQISWQYQVNNRAGGYIVTNTDWNDLAGDLRALIDQTTSSTTDNTPLPIGIDLVNDRVYISDPDSTTPEDGNHADTTLSVVGTTTLAGNTQQTGTFTVGVDDTGHDVKFFGATSGAYMLWDESDDELLIGGGAQLGIGTTAPQCPLVVRDQSNDTVSLLLRANNDGATVGKTYLAINPYDTSVDTYMGTMIGAEEYDAADRRAHMTFWTRGSNSHVAPTERMRITSAGLVGIGQTPVATLGVEAAADPWMHIVDTDTATELLGADSSAVYLAGDGVPIHLKVGCTWNAHPGGSGTTVLECTTSGGIVNLPVSGAQLGISTSSPASMATTVESANLYFYSSNGRLYWNSSSERSKTDIEDVEDAYADKVLDLRPVWFRSTCRDDRKDWGHWGFIAEEVDLVDPRLVSYGPIPRVDDDGDEITDADGVTLNELDDDGENVLRPENVQYDRIIPLLINLIKRQDARIAALEAA